MSYTYASFTTALAAATNIPLTNASFAAYLPTIIDQAEQRIYSDLQLLSTIVRDSSSSTIGGQRTFTLPTPAGATAWVVVQSINLINGTVRTPCVKVSREVIDFIWPSSTGTGAVPDKWAPITDEQVLFGPAPTAAYTVEIYGNIRPAALSASNTSTYLSTELPALFFAAAMVAASAYMRNFGAQSDDPKMAVSWEQQYKDMLPSIQGEEAKRKFAGFYGGN